MRNLIKIVSYCVVCFFCSTAYADGLLRSDQSVNGWQLMAHPTNKTCFFQFTGNDFRVRMGLIGGSAAYRSYVAFFSPDDTWTRTVYLTSVDSGRLYTLIADDFIDENDSRDSSRGLLFFDFPISINGKSTVSTGGGTFTVNFADLSSLGAELRACQSNLHNF